MRGIWWQALAIYPTKMYSGATGVDAVAAGCRDVDTGFNKITLKIM